MMSISIMCANAKIHKRDIKMAVLVFKKDSHSALVETLTQLMLFSVLVTTMVPGQTWNPKEAGTNRVWELCFFFY